jgi:hypothetical protein
MLSSCLEQVSREQRVADPGHLVPLFDAPICLRGVGGAFSACASSGVVDHWPRRHFAGLLSLRCYYLGVVEVRLRDDDGTQFQAFVVIQWREYMSLPSAEHGVVTLNRPRRGAHHVRLGKTLGRETDRGGRSLEKVVLVWCCSEGQAIANILMNH